MTIALATQRETFAVLVTDRLALIIKEDGQIELREVPKIAFHLSLPLACTVAADMAYLPVDLETSQPGWRPITDHIAEVFNEIGPDGLCVRTIAERIRTRLDPLINKYRAGKGDTICSHIALVNNGKADGAFVTIQERTYSCANDLYGRVAPPEIHACVQARLAEVAPLTDPDKIARLMADIVRQAISIEGGKTIGFGVDSAIISGAGVQLRRYPL